jgi:hypothetical protein
MNQITQRTWTFDYMSDAVDWLRQLGLTIDKNDPGGGGNSYKFAAARAPALGEPQTATIKRSRYKDNRVEYEVLVVYRSL